MKAVRFRRQDELAARISVIFLEDDGPVTWIFSISTGYNFHWDFGPNLYPVCRKIVREEDVMRRGLRRDQA